MTYQSYTRGIRLILIVLASLFVLYQFGKVLFEGQRQFWLILAMLYFAIRLVTLYLLFFSVYALVAKIKSIRKLESPVILAIIGTIFVILSYGPPIVAYSMSHDSKIDFKRSPLTAQEVKNKAMSRDIHPYMRLDSVRNYYLDTGERLPYLDDNSREKLFVPDDTALKLYNATTELKLARVNLKIIALSLIGIFVASAICFAIFLWYRFPQEPHK